VTAKKWEITHVIILFLSDCHEVHQAGGMRYEGDYYIKIKPEKTTKPFKVLIAFLQLDVLRGSLKETK
jgi:hypothetical protein